MKPGDQLNQLFRQARQTPRPEPRELGFETRLLAQLREERKNSGLLGRFAWRLAPIFAAITLVAGVWNYTSPVAAHPSDTADLADLGLGDHLLADYLAAN